MNTKSQIEVFKNSLTAAFNAISGGAAQVNLLFEAADKSNHRPGEAEFFSDTSSLVVAFPEELSREQIGYIRGSLDFAALKLRWHDDADNAPPPPNLLATAIMAAAEDARVEAVGRRYMKGAGENLQTRLEHEWRDKLEISGLAGNQPKIIADCIGLVILEEAGFTAPAAADLVMKSYGRFIKAKITPYLPKLKANFENQRKFGEIMLEVIKSLQFPEAAPTEKQLVQNDEHPEEEAAENSPQASSEVMQGLNALAAALQEENNPDKSGQPLPAADKGQENDNIEPAPRNIIHVTNAPHHEYRPYTAIFDRAVNAEELAGHEELTELRRQLDMKLSELKNVTNKLAYKLQRKLLARQAKAWDFGLEEGLLDSARLSRIVSDPGYTHIYKWEKETIYNDTVVTLLIDNSGSMRGRPITVAALSADILARTLERCRIKTEVLGFTTAEWKGGKLRKLWMKNGSPAYPGRLNDLLHIIYKSAGTPWHRAKRNLGLMLKEGLLKENIDGEAILWAASRLAMRPEKRRILMVISDGAPVDDSTLSVMGGTYLDNHLRQTINMVEGGTDIELLAIGIGHDVTGYYKRAVTIREVEQLGDAMIGQLSELI